MRPRRNCAVCGALVYPNNSTFRSRYAYCHAHTDLPGVDNPPADPLTLLPMQSAELTSLEVTSAAREKEA